MKSFIRKKIRALRKVDPHPLHVNAQPPAYDIPEVLEIGCRQSGLSGVRLNLLIPALSLKFSFGGINTAIDFFMSLSIQDSDIRIIITDEVESDLLGLPCRNDWTLYKADDDDTTGKIIVCFGDRYNKSIPIRKNDVFVATAWWTAYNGYLIQKWQEHHWQIKAKPLVYLIQDFEPAFYKWSSRYFLSLGTYLESNVLPVINTKLLSDFIAQNGIKFNEYYIFEPSLNKTLASSLTRLGHSPRKKRIIIYGRPSVERNAFELLAKGLELWSWRYSNAKEWEIISLGETYPSMVLGNKLSINVKGKVSLQEYADLLVSSAVGVSLMISPHPSYPPLEMAAFNLGVLTNSFYNKDLSEYHQNIKSLDILTPDSIAKGVADLCNMFEIDSEYFEKNTFVSNYFVNQSTTFNFITELRNKVLSQNE
ncbi:hypothetical protein DXT99_04350 [Pontibacter diazotrophicus]|uniref:Glycosyltransferase family 1 protein n=1 Tax=Pontibacter diazotrophicus TaxID=1400979 RepID=A0A3D8LGB9_9BACT|nr:hypothetical protein [Pontibacter diazotrophicus]RDV16438.1 hypothetical protein DXT99_04350 [Pontibacter diazotrophicus]